MQPTPDDHAKQPRADRCIALIQIRVTWMRIVGVFAVVLIVGVVVIYRAATAPWHDIYAIWNVSDVVVYHLARTGEWPRSWDDLKVDAAEGFGDRDGSRLAHYESLVDIDFNVDVHRLKAHPAWEYPTPPPFRVIRAKSGHLSHIVEPNQNVWEYLNGVGRPSTLPATTRPLKAN